MGVKGEVKPASGLVPRLQSRLGAKASKKLSAKALDNTQGPRAIVHEQKRSATTIAPWC